MAKTKRSGKRIVEVLGPVDNLESYVRADWWRHLFSHDPACCPPAVLFRRMEVAPEAVTICDKENPNV